MKQALFRLLLLFLLFAEVSVASAQSDDDQPTQDHTAHGSAPAVHEHSDATVPVNESADHSHQDSANPASTETNNHVHQESPPDADGAAHHSAAEPMDHAAMPESMLQSQSVGSLRDPHAYSNGFELDSGPYLLETESQISLADEINFTGLWVDRIEYVESHDFDAREFEGHAWIGDSYNRFLLRSEIEFVNESLKTAELDLLHSRAISPFWNVQFGVRREFGENDERNWASIGLKGLAPYWFEVDASIFLGDNGNTLLDIEADYELLLTQRLVMQPRIDIHSFGKTDKEMGRGSGLSVLKTGFRLRYEYDRQIAPYLGYERVVKYGKTADLLPVGEDRTDNHWIIGFKFWF